MSTKPAGAHGKTPVKRYTYEGNDQEFFDSHSICPPSGDYVSAEDYAALERRVQELEEKAAVYDHINERGSECWEYCRKHADGRLGRNIWHVVLDDALRFRALTDPMPAPPDAGGTR